MDRALAIYGRTEFFFETRFDRDLDAYGVEIEKRFMSKLELLEEVIPNPKLHSGLGLRKLRTKSGDFWEIRLGLRLRAIFRLRHDEATFVRLGSHDEVRRFIKQL